MMVEVQPVRVFETVQTLKPLGVGINLLPHSVRILHQLGLQAALERMAVLTAELPYTSQFGQLIWAEPRGLAAGYAYPRWRGMVGEHICKIGISKDGINIGCKASFASDTGFTPG